jgi:serine/threonine-protein kinase
MLSLVRAGEILNEKFRVDRVLGEGGMGVVVAATHLQLGEQVALKFLREEAMSDANVVQRFAREARTSARIRSEHVARVYDVGELPNGLPFIVMELLSGKDLAAYIEENGALPISEAVDYVLQTCEALAEAHSAGIIHRDLKPSNLFLTQRADGSTVVKVLDFGISKIMSDASGVNDPSLTQTAMVIGTPSYMSPEQMRGRREIDVRADIWSLGVILHEALTGVLPFLGETLTDLCARIYTETPPPVSGVRPDAPEPLDQIVARCLNKEPDARYPDVGSLASELVSFGPADAGARAARIVRILEGRTGAGTSQPPAARSGRQTKPSRNPSSPMGASFGAPPAVRRSNPIGSIAASSLPTPASFSPRSIKAPIIAVVSIGAVAIVVVAWLSGFLKNAGSPPVSAPATQSPSTGLVSTVPATKIAPPVETPQAPAEPPPSTAASGDTSPPTSMAAAGSGAKRGAARSKASKEPASQSPTANPNPQPPINPLDLQFK